MKLNTQITLTVLALSASSVLEFLDGYRLASEHNKEENKIEIFRGKEEFEIDLDQLAATDKAEEVLNDLFVWLDPNDAESVAADWNLHAAREMEMIN